MAEFLPRTPEDALRPNSHYSAYSEYQEAFVRRGDLSAPCTKQSICLSSGAQCVKHDLIVLPKTLEEPRRSILAVTVRRSESHDFGEGSLPVNGAKQPVFESVDGQNEVRECVRLIDQHRDAAGRQTLAHAHRPRQRDRNVSAPTIIGECDRLAFAGAVVSVRDEAVRYHRSAENLDGGVLLPRGQRG